VCIGGNIKKKEKQKGAAQVYKIDGNYIKEGEEQK
jgi:hypothetical protein